MFDRPETDRFWLSGQANVIVQAHPAFPAAYSGDHSLRADPEHATSTLLTLYTGVRVSWRVAGSNTAYSELLSTNSTNASGRLTFAVDLRDLPTGGMINPATYEIVVMGTRADGSSSTVTVPPAGPRAIELASHRT